MARSRSAMRERRQDRDRRTDGAEGRTRHLFNRDGRERSALTVSRVVVKLAKAILDAIREMYVLMGYPVQMLIWIGETIVDLVLLLIIFVFSILVWVLGAIKQNAISIFHALVRWAKDAVRERQRNQRRRMRVSRTPRRGPSDGSSIGSTRLRTSRSRSSGSKSSSSPSSVEQSVLDMRDPFHMQERMRSIYNRIRERVAGGQVLNATDATSSSDKKRRNLNKPRSGTSRSSGQSGSECSCKKSTIFSPSNIGPCSQTCGLRAEKMTKEGAQTKSSQSNTTGSINSVSSGLPRSEGMSDKRRPRSSRPRHRRQKSSSASSCRCSDGRSRRKEKGGSRKKTRSKAALMEEIKVPSEPTVRKVDVWLQSVDPSTASPEPSRSFVRNNDPMREKRMSKAKYRRKKTPFYPRTKSFPKQKSINSFDMDQDATSGNDNASRSSRDSDKKYSHHHRSKVSKKESATKGRGTTSRRQTMFEESPSLTYLDNKTKPLPCVKEVKAYVNRIIIGAFQKDKRSCLGATAEVTSSIPIADMTGVLYLETSSQKGKEKPIPAATEVPVSPGGPDAKSTVNQETPTAQEATKTPPKKPEADISKTPAGEATEETMTSQDPWDPISPQTTVQPNGKEIKSKLSEESTIDEAKPEPLEKLAREESKPSEELKAEKAKYQNSEEHKREAKPDLTEKPETKEPESTEEPQTEEYKPEPREPAEAKPEPTEEPTLEKPILEPSEEPSTVELIFEPSQEPQKEQEEREPIDDPQTEEPQTEYEPTQKTQTEELQTEDAEPEPTEELEIEAPPELTKLTKTEEPQTEEAEPELITVSQTKEAGPEPTEEPQTKETVAKPTEVIQTEEPQTEESDPELTEPQAEEAEPEPTEEPQTEEAMAKLTEETKKEELTSDSLEKPQRDEFQLEPSHEAFSESSVKVKISVESYQAQHPEAASWETEPSF